MRPKDWGDFLLHIEQAQIEAQDLYPESGQHFRMVIDSGQRAMEALSRCWDVLVPHLPNGVSTRNRPLDEVLKDVLERKSNGT